MGLEELLKRVVVWFSRRSGSVSPIPGHEPGNGDTKLRRRELGTDPATRAPRDAAQFAGARRPVPANDAGTSHFQSLFTTSGTTKESGISRPAMVVVNRAGGPQVRRRRQAAV